MIITVQVENDVQIGSHDFVTLLKKHLSQAFFVAFI